MTTGQSASSIGIGTEVLTPDVLATKGVVHIIDHVLPGFRPMGKRITVTEELGLKSHYINK